jgi:hypothetical protein
MKSRPARIGTSNRTAAKVKSRPVPVRSNGNGTNRSRSALAVATAITEKETIQELLLTQPHSLDDYAVRIRALGDRIISYVKFMGTVDQLDGSCAEAKQRSMSMFYDRLIYLDRELNRIQEELQLG